jgi:hypothetical protein
MTRKTARRPQEKPVEGGLSATSARRPRHLGSLRRIPS